MRRQGPSRQTSATATSCLTARSTTACLRNASSFRGERSESPESITTIGSMDSGPAPCGASRNDEELFLRGITVHGIDPQHRLRLLYRFDIEIDRDRLAVAAHQDAFQDLVAAGVDLLMRHVRRHEDEIAGAGFGGELQLLAPAHPRLALHHIDDALEMAVMMRAGLRVGPDRDGARPQLLRTGAGKIDRGLAVHA